MSRGTAVVTGASAGIGREFCRQLAERGYDLVLVARDEARLRELAAELSAREEVAAQVLRADLTRDDDMDRVIERLRAPDVTLLVNNAGFGTVGSLAAADPVQQERMIRLHVLAPMRLTQGVLPGFLAHGGGGILNVSSVASFIYAPGNVNYCATKAYLTTFSEGLATELRGTGVRVQALCPGFTHSEFHQRMGEDTKRRPRFSWLAAPDVVRASLDQLERGGPVICVPGVGYKLLVALIRVLPRRLIGRLTGVGYRRL
jgi:short-subunit dehydrogenase